MQRAVLGLLLALPALVACGHDEAGPTLPRASDLGRGWTEITRSVVPGRADRVPARLDLS